LASFVLFYSCLQGRFALVRKVVVSVLALLVASAAVALASSGSDVRQASTLVLHVDLSKQAFRDLPPRGSSPGDLFVDRLAVSQNGHSAGFGHEDCRATFPTTRSRVELQCDEFLSLQGLGDITAQGVLNLVFAKGGPQPAVFAITGGTGHYENVRGQITTRPTKDREVWTLHLLP
jgi:hypothetical protein